MIHLGNQVKKFTDSTQYILGDYIMKRLVLGGLSVLLMSATVVPALRAEVIAETVPANVAQTPVTNVPPNIAARMAVTPFNLVFLAFQGFFEAEGIPSSMSFLSAYRTKQVTAVDLVKIAVKMNRLPQSTLDDQRYIKAVNSQLEALLSGSR
ncbi:MAG TPA: hypothetical protein DCE56_28960 [Cyanobacteria bacterium UBA8553]|nr:hypothetical protein [Cyanobacteria bacterium UBA8553]HAJ58266.1 hypothetical protein [Cyanobacteria bacterium UBA8543]